MSSIPAQTRLSSFDSEIKTETGVPVNKCYQCGKCSAGCPLSAEMDYPPSVVLRMLQTREPALNDKILRSMSIWLCLSCEMCLSRCPMEIDIPKLMDFLRQRSLAQGKVNPAAHKILSFHKSFLDSLNFTGRLYEMGMIVDYKMRTGALTQDVKVAPRMFVKGKLNPVPEIIKGRKSVSSIFAKTINHKEGK